MVKPELREARKPTCPATKGIRSGFMSKEAYEEVCERYRKGTVTAWGKKRLPSIYAAACERCPNKKGKKKFLHGAYLLPTKTVSEVYKKYSR